MQPLVSILIPAFNAARFLSDTLESAVAQTYSRCEVIVIDDGSVDTTPAILARYANRISCSSQSNSGQAITRNRLLAESGGEYLLFLDADDIIASDKVAKQVERLVADASIDLCLDDMRLFCSSIDEAGELFPCPIGRDPWIALISTAFPFTSAGLWRRSALEAMGGWQEGIVTGHEYNRYFELLRRGGKICFSSGGRTFYRMPSKEKPNLRNAAVTLRERMAFLTEVASHLHAVGMMTDERRAALAMARLQGARKAWQVDRTLALHISRTVPPGDIAVSRVSPATPQGYLYAYKAFGFQVAERMADLKRSLSGA